MRWSELPGKRFGPYEVMEEVGRGGTSRVFRALDHDLQREVAFKVIPNDADDRLAFIQRFIRETEIVTQLHHPNILPVFDAGETDEFVFQAMQFVRGVTLRQRATTQRMGAQEAAQYILQAALALQHAHALGIVHRDVKPSNMLLPNDDPTLLLLTDFGTAKILGARGPTKTGAAIGTPEYMSPEQAEGKDVDQRSDIYSLGCTLYEALAGRPPFVGATPVSVLYQQVHAQPTYIRSYNGEAPRELWAVLRTCLAKRPVERYGSAKQLAEDLRPFAEGLIQPTPAPWRAPATGRLPLDTHDRSPNRPLHAQPSRQLDGPPSGAPLPPPYTPNSQPLPPEMRGPRVTRRLEAGSGYAPPASAPGFDPRGPAATSGPLRELGPIGDRGAFGPWSGPPGTTMGAPSPGMTQGPGSMASGIAPGITPGPVSMPRPEPLSGPVSAPGFSASGAPAWPSIPPAYRSQTSGPLVNGASGQYRIPPAASHRAPGSSGNAVTYGPRVAVMSGPRPAVGSRALPKRTWPPSWLPTLGVGALATAMLIAAVVMGAIGLGLVPGGVSARPARNATPAATRTASATATPAAPTTTAPSSAQQLLDQEAASAFRSITITPYVDHDCLSSNQTINYASGQTVYANLCVASRTMPGPVTVVIRSGGRVIWPILSGWSPDGLKNYSRGHSLGPGSYDMLITVSIHGKTATAKDIAFTVS